MEFGSIQQYGKVVPQFGEPTQNSQTDNGTVDAGAKSMPERKFSKQEVEGEIRGINKWLQSTNTHLKFTLHEKLNDYYVQVINDQTNEVIREIPSKKVMDFAAKMHEMIGLLIDEKR